MRIFEGATLGHCCRLCKLSCIVCRAFIARSSDICSRFCAGETVAEKSSQPFGHPSSLASVRVISCHGPWLKDLLLLTCHRRTQQACAHTWAPYTSAGLETNERPRQAERRKPGVKMRKATVCSETSTLARQCVAPITAWRLEFQGTTACAALSFSLGASLFLASFCVCFVQRCEFHVEEWDSVGVPSCRGSSQWTNGCVDNKSGFGEEDDSNTGEVSERELVLVFVSCEAR